MCRMIDADAFDKRIRLDVGSCEEELTEDFKDGISTILEMMKTAPTVDVVPARHGRWKMVEGELAFWDMCSACGRKIVHRTPYYDFCPNCGAKMNEEDNEQKKQF